MLDPLIGLLGEEAMILYLTYRVKKLLPLFTALLYIYLYAQHELALKPIYNLTQHPINLKTTSRYEYRILIWRIRCLSKTIDEEAVTPIY